MNSQNEETLRILQEECAEVVQAISKIFRFGLDGVYNDRTNRQRLSEEIGDLLAMIDLLEQQGIVDRNMLIQYKQRKFNKLEAWSSIIV
jgi:NTP pyrophosphatase (non-canonical NTP hydrolase)